MKVKKNENVDDVIDFIFDGNQSDLQILVQMRKKMTRSKMQYNTAFLMANQLMLQKLTMTFFLLL